MSFFNDSDCLDRIGVVIAGIAGVAGTVVGGAAVGGGLLAAACAGRAVLLGRLGGPKSRRSKTYANDKKLSTKSIDRQCCLRIAENRYKRQIFDTKFSV